MGITIFAKGKIDRIGDIPQVIDDLMGIAAKHDWEYHIIADEFDSEPNDARLTPLQSGNQGVAIEGSLGLKGIILKVDKGAEAFQVLFDRSGALTDMMQQMMWIENKKSDRFTICKTQFAGIEAHIAMIELLDDLKKRYISDLVVTDEGAYWETRDRRILAEKRIRLGHYLRHAEKVIGAINLSGEDVRDPETLATRIEEALLQADEKGRLDQ